MRLLGLCVFKGLGSIRLKHGFHALIGAFCLGCSCQFQNYNPHLFPLCFEEHGNKYIYKLIIQL
jgi:hypothetical protein